MWTGAYGKWRRGQSHRWVRRRCAGPMCWRLLKALGDPDEDVRREAVKSLGEAVAHPELLHALVSSLGDSDAGARQRASRALRQMGGATVCRPDVLQTLVKALDDPDKD